MECHVKITDWPAYYVLVNGNPEFACRLGAYVASHEGANPLFPQITVIRQREYTIFELNNIY